MSIIFGTTNTDGSGSSHNLDEGNGITITDGVNSTNGVNSIVTEDGLLHSIAVNADEWNGADNKEIRIDENADYIRVDDFVDVEITNGAENGFSHIEILNAKRGQIDTTAGDSDDSIVIGVNSNNDHWENDFNIETGSGSDMIKMMNVNNSKYTEFDIDSGEGNDTVDVSELEIAAKSSQLRHVDGGEGLDVLVTNGDATIDFEGFEVVEGAGFDSTLSLDSDLIANNADLELGLVVYNIDVEIEADYTVTEITDAQAEYLDELGYEADDFTALTVTTDDGEYSVLTDDSSYAVA